MTTWSTTVTSVVLIFRDALRALVPHVAQARIEWRESRAYDDWDEIAQVLFEKIVVASVHWALPEADRSRTELAAYDVMYDSYADKAVIAIDSPDSGRLIFHSFATYATPFDTVRARVVDRDGRPTKSDFVVVGADSVTYRVEVSGTTMEHLTVEV